MTFKDILENKNLLLGITFISFILFIYLLLNNKFLILFLFILFGVIFRVFTGNMLIILSLMILISLVLLFFVSPKQEELLFNSIFTNTNTKKENSDVYNPQLTKMGEITNYDIFPFYQKI
jgi:hypothetical protein